MANGIIGNTEIIGVSSAVPSLVRDVSDDAKAFGEDEARRISEAVGVNRRCVVSPEICTSDLCFAAAERLLADLRWDRGTVDALVFVSQTPDYILPATACILHGRLGLAKQCAALDVNLGCSGYVYGLWLISHLIACGNVKRGLLLTGDTISRIVSPQDRSTAPLFGDAGTATALQYNAAAPPIFFELGTDGTGAKHLIVPAGGFRRPHTDETARRTEREGGNVRSEEDLFMDGAEVFAFTLREVPPMIKAVLNASQWTADSVDAFVMHQANRFMLQHLAKRLRIPLEKMPFSLHEYGNTSVSSIPLTLSHALSGDLKRKQLRLVLAGFGVGLSWGAAALACGPITSPDIVSVSGC